MNKIYNINIKNGKGYMDIDEDIYSVEANVKGYIEGSIRPEIIEIEKEINNYEFGVGAEGTLSIKVTEEGTVGSTPIKGAKFVRCDKNGNEYGEQIITNENGETIFWNIPYDINSKNIILYFKQTSSDGKHIFDDSLNSIIMDEHAKSILIANHLLD